MLIHVNVTEDVYVLLAKMAMEVEAQIGEYCSALLIAYVTAPPEERIAALNDEIYNLNEKIAELEKDEIKAFVSDTGISDAPSKDESDPE